MIWNSLLPFFFTSLKVSLPRAVSACIVGEFLVSTEGVGHYIEHAREFSDTVGVFAGIVVATTLVLAINGLVEYLERRALRLAPRRPRHGAVRHRASFDYGLRPPLSNRLGRERVARVCHRERGH